MPRSPENERKSPRHAPLMPRNANGKRVSRTQSAVSVIELSSGDEGDYLRSPAKPASKRKKVTPAPGTEVLEISSDEDEAPLPPKSAIPPEIRKQLAQLPKLQKETERLKKERAAFSQKVTDLEAALATATTSKAGRSSELSADDLEDNVCCEICTGKMWTPYMLECGHTFCSQCLQDWFQTSLANHINRHPNYHANNQLPAQIQDLIHAHRHNPAMVQQITNQYQGYLPPSPEYTCPTCRDKVKHKPIEAFGLKEIVRKVAAAQGESSPRKAAAPAPAAGKGRKGKGKAVAPPPLIDPFATYF